MVHFCGVRKDFDHEGIALSDCIVPTCHSPPMAVPPEFEDVDIGEREPVRCLRTGIWLLEEKGSHYVILLSPASRFGSEMGVKFQVGTMNSPAGTHISRRFFDQLEEAVQQATSYRGKILSLEEDAALLLR